MKCSKSQFQYTEILTSQAPKFGASFGGTEKPRNHFIDPTTSRFFESFSFCSKPFFFYSKPRNQVKSHNIKIVQFTCIKALLIGSALSKNADTIFSSEIIYMCMSTQLVPPTCYATCAKLGINILLASMFFLGVCDTFGIPHYHRFVSVDVNEVSHTCTLWEPIFRIDQETWHEFLWTNKRA